MIWYTTRVLFYRGLIMATSLKKCQLNAPASYTVQCNLTRNLAIETGILKMMKMIAQWVHIFSFSRGLFPHELKEAHQKRRRRKIAQIRSKINRKPNIWCLPLTIRTNYMEDLTFNMGDSTPILKLISYLTAAMAKPVYTQIFYLTTPRENCFRKF